jgi:hypothetical protein
VGEPFESVVKMYAKLVEIPYIPITFTPFPISRVSAPECRKFIEGNDPITGRPIVDEIVEVLTKPLSEEQKHAGIEERPVLPRLIGPDIEENLHKFFLENAMTDYLPIVLPTEERVSEMLKGTSHKPDEVLVDIRAAYEAYSITVEKVAAIAVMAGAKPEYLPVILAMAASGVSGLSTSTQSFTVTIAINGPIRNEIKMNSGIGAMSPLNQANAVIGRVATLIAMNTGGGRPGDTYWGSQGNTLDYNHATFAENEEALPADWKPFHVQNGFKSEESVISFFRGYGVWHWKNTNEFEKHKAVVQMADWMLPSNGICLLLDPIVARQLVDEGFSTKESVSNYTYENSLVTIEEFWKYQHMDTTRHADEKGYGPHAPFANQPKDKIINRYRKPDDISVLVVGGGTNDFWQAVDAQYMGSFLIDEWR